MTKQKNALVTGGTGGIGSAICRGLADDGHKVIAGYFAGGKHKKAKDWQAKHKDQGYNFEISYGAVPDFDSCTACIKQIEEQFGKIDILVNNAGITRDSAFKKMSNDQWYDVINVDLNGVYNMTRLVIENMIKNQWGRVVNISSINAQKGQFGQTNYSAAKAGMHGFTKALAQEVASKGITVNTISPGYIATEMVMAVPEKVRQHIINAIPVGRLGQPEEIARVVSFLCNAESGFITGSNIAANGGQHMM